VCLKWEALLAEGERPRAFESMVFGLCAAAGRQAGGGMRLMLCYPGSAAGYTRAARAKVGSLGLGYG
jgi:hypothetical protein